MTTCPKCGRELADGARFCKFCGSQVLQTNMQNNTQRPVQNIQVTTPAPKKKKSSKGIIIAVIAVLLVALIVLGVIFIPDLLGKKDLTDKEKLTKLLEESTTKPIVEFVYVDYDSDGTYEAYAVVGETDEEDEKHPEFYDADIYFVNHKKAQPVKENVSGQVNGTMKVDDNKYISIEVYNDGTDEGKSFIYTADGTKSDEADISGKYSRVHKENGKIIGFDENGNEVDLTAEDKNEQPENAETPTAVEFDNSVYDNVIETYRNMISGFKAGTLTESEEYQDYYIVTLGMSDEETYKYAYADINGDDIPELLIASYLPTGSDSNFNVDGNIIVNIWEYENETPELLMDNCTYGYRSNIVPCQNGMLLTYGYPGGGQDVYQFYEIGNISDEPTIVENAEAFNNWVGEDDVRYAVFSGECIYNESDIPAENFVTKEEYEAVLNKYVPLSGFTWYDL